MLLLAFYILIALVFSFLCSIAEAVLLSINSSYIVLLEHDGKRSGTILRELSTDIGKPLTAILTLNTIAHTVGAVGAGAQAAVVFGSAYLGIASAILTLLILVFSEIIPKTLGALHWRKLAPATAYGLRVLVWVLLPFIWLSEKMTGRLSEGARMSGFSRQELAAMAAISAEEGHLAAHESEIVNNLMHLRKIRVMEVMTPRTVVFSLPESLTVGDYFERHSQVRFSRIPVFGQDADQVTGFVLRADIVTAFARGDRHRLLRDFRRDLLALPESIPLSKALNVLLPMEAHVALVVDEYGDQQGIVTLEDIIETLLGLEIVDEGDETVDMRELARVRWQRKARQMGLQDP